MQNRRNTHAQLAANASEPDMTVAGNGIIERSTACGSRGGAEDTWREPGVPAGLLACVSISHVRGRVG